MILVVRVPRTVSTFGGAVSRVTVTPGLASSKAVTMSAIAVEVLRLKAYQLSSTPAPPPPAVLLSEGELLLAGGVVLPDPHPARASIATATPTAAARGAIVIRVIYVLL